MKPKDVIGDWVVERTLGKGGMGTVFLCHHREDVNDKAALKTFSAWSTDEDGFRRFERECEVLGRLDHPGIVPLKTNRVASGRDPEASVYWLAMAFIDGPSLETRLDDGPLPPGYAAQVFSVVGGALAHAHSKGVFHRDIKPANLVMGTDGPRLVDFGIALQTDRTRLTAMGTLAGTLAYMAPEVVADDRIRPNPVLCDIYALGVVLFEALTARRAFATEAGLSERARQMRIIKAKMTPEVLDPGEGVPEPLREAVRRAAHPDPAVRLRDWAEFHALLNQVPFEADRTHTPAPALPAKPPPAGEARARRKVHRPSRLLRPARRPKTPSYHTSPSTSLPKVPETTPDPSTTYNWEEASEDIAPSFEEVGTEEPGSDLLYSLIDEDDDGFGNGLPTLEEERFEDEPTAPDTSFAPMRERLDVRGGPEPFHDPFATQPTADIPIDFGDDLDTASELDSVSDESSISQLAGDTPSFPPTYTRAPTADFSADHGDTSPPRSPDAPPVYRPPVIPPRDTSRRPQPEAHTAPLPHHAATPAPHDTSAPSSRTSPSASPASPPPASPPPRGDVDDVEAWQRKRERRTLMFLLLLVAVLVLTAGGLMMMLRDVQVSCDALPTWAQPARCITPEESPEAVATPTPTPVPVVEAPEVAEPTPDPTPTAKPETPTTKRTPPPTKAKKKLPIQFTATHGEATVYIDSKRRGPTPLTLSLEPGRYILEFAGGDGRKKRHIEVKQFGVSEYEFNPGALSITNKFNKTNE